MALYATGGHLKIWVYRNQWLLKKKVGGPTKSTLTTKLDIILSLHWVQIPKSGILYTEHSNVFSFTGFVSLAQNLFHIFGAVQNTWLSLGINNNFSFNNSK